MCYYFNISRSGYYKSLQSKEHKKLCDKLILKLVLDYRKLHPRLGCSKLYYLFENAIRKIDKHFGRNKLFSVLQTNDLLVKRKTICKGAVYKACSESVLLYNSLCYYLALNFKTSDDVHKMK